MLGTILGGQTLASVANGNLSWRYVLIRPDMVSRISCVSCISVGVVVIAIVSLLVSFCGYTVLNW